MSLLGGLIQPLLPLAPLSPTQTTPQPADSTVTGPDPAPLPPDPPPAPQSSPPETAPAPVADQAALSPAAIPAAAPAQPTLPDPLVRLQVESAVRAGSDRPMALPPPASADDLAEARRLALAAQERFLMERMVERQATPPVPAPGLPDDPGRKADTQRVTASAPTLNLRR